MYQKYFLQSIEKRSKYAVVTQIEKNNPIRPMDQLII